MACSNIEKPDFGVGGTSIHDYTDTGGGLLSSGHADREVTTGRPSGPDGGPCVLSASPIQAGEQLSRLEFVGYEASPTDCAEQPGGTGSMSRSGACPSEIDQNPSQCGFTLGISEAFCDGDTDLRDANWTAGSGGTGNLAPHYYKMDECFDAACEPCDATACARAYRYAFDPAGGNEPCGTYGPTKVAAWFVEADADDDCTSMAAACAPGSGR